MPSLKARRGFTLIEFVVGIVLLAIALTGILGLLVNQTSRAVDPVQQVRAAQLAQRILNEVLQKSFDEHSDHNGGRFRCGETVGTPPVIYPACTPVADYGPDGGETRSYEFNDVDDYQTGAICGKGLASCDGDWVPANYFSAQSGQGLDESEYRQYGIRIRVSGVDLTNASLPTCTGPCSTGKRIEDEAGNPLDQGACLRFWPIVTASRYLGSAASAGLTIVVPDVLPERNKDLAIVYPLADPNITLEQGCLHGNCVASVTSVGASVSGALPLTVDGSFAKESPGQRIYFARQQVRYCVMNAALTRASAAIGTDIRGSTPVLMAEHIRFSPYYFYREPAAFNQSEVGLRMEFEQRGERVLFNHKLETLNVP